MLRLEKNKRLFWQQLQKSLLFHEGLRTAVRQVSWLPDH